MKCFLSTSHYGAFLSICFLSTLASVCNVLADSVNSPNVTLNVDTNRSAGNGAGNVPLTINTITLAEITANEYSSGAISIAVRPGFQLDPDSDVTALSATIGFNGGAINTVAAVTPTGSENEVITFNLTNGASGGQDIIRISGVKLKILNTLGAAGPAQTTMSITTSTAGGGFTNQGIVAALIQKGAADRLEFAIQPGSNQAGVDLLPAVKIVDFGGNLVEPDAPLKISLALQSNPGMATLQGVTEISSDNSVTSWEVADGLQILVTGNGYTLRASHDGDAFLTSDTVDSEPFDISSGNPGRLAITQQPSDTAAGDDILIEVTAFDEFENVLTGSNVDITLDSAINPGGWPLLSENGLTKTTVSGIATWNANDRLRILTAIEEYRLFVSGLGEPLQTDAFDIVPGDPAGLRFVQHPTTVLEDTVLDPPVSVEIVDEFGNRTDSNAQVNLSLINAPCGGSLSGGAATAVDGLATFIVLAIDTACENDQLTASAEGLPSIDSDAFDVTPAECGVCGDGAALMMAPMLFVRFFWLGRSTRKAKRP